MSCQPSVESFEPPIIYNTLIRKQYIDPQSNIQQEFFIQTTYQQLSQFRHRGRLWGLFKLPKNKLYSFLSRLHSNNWINLDLAVVHEVCLNPRIIEKKFYSGTVDNPGIQLQQKFSNKTTFRQLHQFWLSFRITKKSSLGNGTYLVPRSNQGKFFIQATHKLINLDIRCRPVPCRVGRLWEVEHSKPPII